MRKREQEHEQEKEQEHEQEKEQEQGDKKIWSRDAYS